MSEFRDQVSNELINAGGHPQRTHDILTTLEDSMVRKVADAAVFDDADEDFLNGMLEMRAFVRNLASDIAREYGIEKEKGN